jgi:preprotein translocase subunit SecG
MSNDETTWILAGLYIICIAVVAVLEWNAHRKGKNKERQESRRR